MANGGGINRRKLFIRINVAINGGVSMA